MVAVAAHGTRAQEGRSTRCTWRRFIARVRAAPVCDAKGENARPSNGTKHLDKSEVDSHLCKTE